MGAIVKAFEKVGECIKNGFEATMNAFKAAMTTLGDTFKGLMEHTLAMMQAVATGDLKKAGEAFLKLGATMADLATLPESMAANAALELVKGAMKNAAEMLNMKDQPWMEKAMESISMASNFTSLGKAATFMGEEVLAVANGEQGQLGALVSSRPVSNQV